MRILTRQCNCEKPPAWPGYIWRCDHGLYWLAKSWVKGSAQATYWRKIATWRAHRMMLRHLKQSLNTHTRNGFRSAFSLRHVHDFYCSNKGCQKVHKVI